MLTQTVYQGNHVLDRRNTSDAIRKPYREVRNALVRALPSFVRLGRIADGLF